MRGGQIRGRSVRVGLCGEQFVGGRPGEMERHKPLPLLDVLIDEQNVGDVEEAAEGELVRIAPLKRYPTGDVAADAPRPRGEGEGSIVGRAVCTSIIQVRMS